MLGVVVHCLMLGAPWRVRSGVSGAEGGVDPSVSAGSGDGLTSRDWRIFVVNIYTIIARAMAVTSFLPCNIYYIRCTILDLLC